MKIISESGKRIDGKESDKAIKKMLKEEDPIIRNAEKDDSEELTELLKSHIFREDNTLFPMAQKLLTIRRT